MEEVIWAFHQTVRPVSFRVNSLKSDSQTVESDVLSHKIDFLKLDFLENSYILGENFRERDLWKTESYKNGHIYIQGISSQIPVHFFDTNSLLQGKMKPHFKILDACAAPGGKTSQLAAKFPDAEIWAFEPNTIRFQKMIHNFKKLWINPILQASSKKNDQPQIICINDSVENIWNSVSSLEYFDMILVDAPCSGEGGISANSQKFLESWSLSHIKKNYARQKAICSSILPYLKNQWEFIYSTCTIAPEENEAIAHFLLSWNFWLISEKLDIKENKFIKPTPALKLFERFIFRKEVSQNTIRVMPSSYSEWFYISKFRKNESDRT